MIGKSQSMTYSAFFPSTPIISLGWANLNCPGTGKNREERYQVWAKIISSSILGIQNKAFMTDFLTMSYNGYYVNFRVKAKARGNRETGK